VGILDKFIYVNSLAKEVMSIPIYPEDCWDCKIDTSKEEGDVAYIS